MPHNIELSKLSYETLVEAVGPEGIVLVGGRRRYPTTVRAVRGRLEFVPGSTGVRRSGLSRRKIDEVLSQVRQTGSLKAADYADVSSQAGYVTALVAALLR